MGSLLKVEKYKKNLEIGQTLNKYFVISNLGKSDTLT